MLRCALAALGLMLATAQAAWAQGLDGERFAPAAGAAGGLAVERPVVLDHLGFALGVFPHLAEDSLVLRSAPGGSTEAELLELAVSVDLVASFGLFDWFELAMDLPQRLVYLPVEGRQLGNDGLRAIKGSGDVRLVPKASLFRRGDQRRGVVLGLAIPVTLPTGNAAHLRGSGGVTVEPRGLAMGFADAWSLAASLGFRFRSPEADYAPGNELTFGLAASYTPPLEERLLDLQVELLGGWLPAGPTLLVPALPLEVLAGLTTRPTARLSFYAGGGAGFTDATPDYRIITGVRYTAGAARIGRPAMNP